MPDWDHRSIAKPANGYDAAARPWATRSAQAVSDRLMADIVADNHPAPARPRPSADNPPPSTLRGNGWRNAPPLHSYGAEAANGRWRKT